MDEMLLSFIQVMLSHVTDFLLLTDFLLGNIF